MQPPPPRKSPAGCGVLAVDHPGLVRLAARRVGQPADDERGAAVAGDDQRRRRRRSAPWRSRSALEAPRSTRLGAPFPVERVRERARPDAEADRHGRGGGSDRRDRGERPVPPRGSGTTVRRGSARARSRIRSRSAAGGAGPRRRKRGPRRPPGARRAAPSSARSRRGAARRLALVVVERVERVGRDELVGVGAHQVGLRDSRAARSGRPARTRRRRRGWHAQRRREPADRAARRASVRPKPVESSAIETAVKSARRPRPRPRAPARRSCATRRMPTPALPPIPCTRPIPKAPSGVRLRACVVRRGLGASGGARATGPVLVGVHVEARRGASERAARRRARRS